MKKKNDLKVRFINEVNKTKLSDHDYLQNLFYLLINDSIYGKFVKKVRIDKNILFINNQKIEFFLGDIGEVNFNKFKIDTLVDCSGEYNSDYKNKKSLKNFRVVMSSNYKDADITLVHGINNKDYLRKKHRLISASSCTGQALIPFAKLIDDHFSITNGFINTIHPSLSNDSIIDNPKQAFHQGRSSKNIKLVESKVVKSTVKVLPNLKNKLFAKSLSCRVPTDIVTSILGVIQVDKKINSKEQILKLIKKNSKNIYVCEGFNNQPLVSIDYLKNKHPCIIPLEWLDVNNEKLIRFSIWQDNEYGYCNQLYKTVIYVNSKN